MSIWQFHGNFAIYLCMSHDPMYVKECQRHRIYRNFFFQNLDFFKKKFRLILILFHSLRKYKIKYAFCIPFKIKQAIFGRYPIYHYKL